jgi:hypothetical protein
MNSQDWKRLGDGLNSGGSALLWLAVFLLFGVPALFIVAAGLFH